jgi:flagellar biosynthesis protein FlhG
VKNNSDQASRLRSLFNQREAEQKKAAGARPRARVIAVSGGKGGVGKTNIAANLAMAMASLGKRVALVDADYALANIDILLGFNPTLTLEHVLNGQRNVGEILIDGPGGIKIVPASSGVQNLTHLDSRQESLLYKALQMLEMYFDVLLVDTAAGISDDVITVLRSAGETIVVTNPEPPAFVDSYALIKHVLGLDPGYKLKVVVNQVDNEKEALAVFDRISKTVVKFLKGTVEYGGFVLEDRNVKKAVRARKAFYLQYPASEASTCIQSLAVKLLKARAAEPAGFAERLQGFMKKR